VWKGTTVWDEPAEHGWEFLSGKVAPSTSYYPGQWTR